MFFKKIFNFFYKEIKLEIRSFNSINETLLYLMSITFLCYMSLSINNYNINKTTWNILFWITMIFTYIDFIKKNFLKIKNYKYMYYYSLSRPEVFIFFKFFYNTIALIIISFLGYLFFILFLGDPIKNKILFIVNVILASTNFASILTLISSISSKSYNENNNISIINISIIIPIITIIIQISNNAIDGIETTSSILNIITILIINISTLLLSNILFPYLWKE